MSEKLTPQEYEVRNKNIIAAYNDTGSVGQAAKVTGHPSGIVRNVVNRWKKSQGLTEPRTGSLESMYKQATVKFPSGVGSLGWVIKPAYDMTIALKTDNFYMRFDDTGLYIENNCKESLHIQPHQMREMKDMLERIITLEGR